MAWRNQNQRISPDHELRWGHLGDMFGDGAERLKPALAALAPISRREVDAMIVQAHLVSLGRRPMRPVGAADRDSMLHKRILETASATASYLRHRDEHAGGPVPRNTSVSMLLELIDKLGDPEVLQNKDACLRQGWLWGPSGPPIKDPRHTVRAGSGYMKIWETHAAATGAALDRDNLRNGDARYYGDLLQANALHAARVNLSDNMVSMAAYTAESIRSHANPLIQDSGWMNAGEGTAMLEAWSDQSWAQSDMIRDAAQSAMRAAVFVAVERSWAADLDDESLAMDVLTSIMWGEGIIDRWNEHAPARDPDAPLSFWLHTSPTPVEYWVSAHTTARFEGARMAAGDDGVAHMLIGRRRGDFGEARQAAGDFDSMYGAAGSAV